MNTRIIKKIVITFRQEGFSQIFVKAKRRLVYFILRLKNRNEQHVIQWEKLKNKFEGERIFLIGNGPSLNQTPLYFLKDEYTMCFNRFHMMEERLNWNPFFFLTADNLVMTDLLQEIDEVLTKTEYAFFPDIHFRGYNYAEKIQKDDKDKVYWIQQAFGKGFSTDLPKVFLGGTVVYEGFQILNYLGFKEIYFVGIDMNYKIHETAKVLKAVDIVGVEDDDPNHFDPRYFGKDKTYHQPRGYIVNNMVESLKYLSTINEELNLNIVNAGYDSKVDFFPKSEFEDIFNYSDEIKKELFEECISNNTKYSTLDDFLADAELFGEKKDFNPEIGNFYINSEIGIKLIEKAIFSHIPYGPYNGNYYFVKRVENL